MANFDDLLNSTPTTKENAAQQQFSKAEYAAKKQAERETVYNLADDTAIEVTADDGKFQAFLDVQGRFDRYSAVNALLIFAQNPEATRLGSFDYWKNQRGSVTSGQSGISILEPGKEYLQKDGSIGIGYNIKKVFDISQVGTRRLKYVPTPSFDERQILGALLSNPPVKITGVDELPEDLGAETNPETGEISVR
jgi:hypothetical protein